MALKKLTLRPGVNKEGTNYSNEDGFYNCDKIRFRSGYAEKLGGWINITPGYTFKGIARSLWAWVVSNANGSLVSIATTQKFYIQYSGKNYDITPYNDATYTAPIPLVSGTIVTDGSLLATVTYVDHNLAAGTFVSFANVVGVLASDITDANLAVPLVSATGFPSSGTVQIDSEQISYTSITTNTLDVPYGPPSGRGVNGTLAAEHTAGAYVVSQTAISIGGVDFNSAFEIVKVVDINTFQIKLPTTATASSNGATVYMLADIPAGSASEATLNGWGAPPWGYLGWGSGSLVAPIIPARYWSQSNFDEDLVFASRYSNIYWWTKSVPAFARAITLNAKANTQVKQTLLGDGTSTGASYTSGNNYMTVTDTTGINFGSVVTGPGIPAGTYVTTAWDQSTTVTLSANVTSSQTYVTVTFSYSGRHIPVKTLLIATSSQNAFVIAFGATPYNPYVFSNAANFDPLLVRWSDQDNPYEWVPEITNQSGEQRLSNGSYIVTAANTRQEVLVWTDTALYSMQYLGPPYVWGINLLMDNLSIAGQNAAITVNNVTYWMGVDKFYSYSGRVDTLNCTLRSFIFNNINRDRLAQIACGSNEGFNEIWWFYPTADSTINNAYVIYNHVENLWYYGTMMRTTWLDTQLRKYPIGAFSVQNSFLDYPMTSTDNTITLINAAPYPNSGVVIIDSEEITYTSKSGNVLICTRGAGATSHSIYSAVTYKVPNQMMFHEYGYDDLSTSTPTPIEAYIESSDFDIEDGLNFSYVWRIIPDLTFSGSTSPYPQCQLTVKVRQNSGAAYTVGSTDATSVTRTATYPVEQYTGQVYTRVRGRQMALRMASVDLGVFWQMGMMRIDIRPDGRR
jgi:hypothetical protein